MSVFTPNIILYSEAIGSEHNFPELNNDTDSECIAMKMFDARLSLHLKCYKKAACFRKHTTLRR